MSLRLLILDGSIDTTTYRPVEQWARHLDGIAFDSVHLPSGEQPPPLDSYTHLLITGSEASFSEPQPWFEREADVVRNAADRDLAVLGSCFGHQILVWALSGQQYVRRAPTPELGWIAVDILVADPLLKDVPNPWHTFTAHLDEVIDPPPPWRVLAATGACRVQAIRYGDRPIWGIQPHPETEPEEAKQEMGKALETHPEYAEPIRQAMAEPVRDDRVTRSLAAAFLRSHA